MIQNCPVCSSSYLVSADTASNAGYLAEILCCRMCTSLINKTALSNLSALSGDNREIQNTDFYDSSNIPLSVLSNEIDINVDNLTNICNLLEFDSSDAVFLDFGAGRGCASVAAAKIFRSVIAVDYNSAVVKATAKLFGFENNVSVFEDIKLVNYSFDFVFVWHVLEHVPLPVSFLRELFERTTKSGCIAIQVPKYRSEYVIDCHFVFYNHYSISLILKRVGFLIKHILDDFDSHFLTVLAVKP